MLKKISSTVSSRHMEQFLVKISRLRLCWLHLFAAICQGHEQEEQKFSNWTWWFIKNSYVKHSKQQSVLKMKHAHPWQKPPFGRLKTAKKRIQRTDFIQWNSLVTSKWWFTSGFEFFKWISSCFFCVFLLFLTGRMWLQRGTARLVGKGPFLVGRKRSSKTWSFTNDLVLLDLRTCRVCRVWSVISLNYTVCVCSKIGGNYIIILMRNLNSFRNKM